MKVRNCERIRKALLVIAASLTVLVSYQSLFAQANTGHILGTITDQSGGVVAGATVTILDQQRGISRPLTTDSAGAYSAPNLIPGAYTVRAEANGFQRLERANIPVEVGEDVRVDLQLRPGNVTQTVTVTGEAPVINTTNATLGQALSTTQINSLPLNGRNFTNLMALKPGVAIYPGGGAWTQSSDDLRSHDQNYIVDGVDANDPWGAQAILNGGLPGGDASTLIPIDAIDQFRDEMNAPAAYGWKPGAVVNVGIKSGTNEIHGTAYAFGRSDAFDARNFFDQPPAPLTPVQLEQFGASVGGPIKHNKLFYFASYEDQRYTVGNPLLTTVPITSPTSSDPSSLIGACQSALDIGAPGSGTPGALTNLSASLAGIKVGPAISGHPNGVCAPASNFPGLFVANTGSSPSLFSDLNTDNQIDSGVLKINYNINEHNSVNGLFIYSNGAGTQIDAGPTEVRTDWATFQTEHSQVVSADWVWTPRSTLVNELRFSQAREFSNFYTPDHTLDPANYAFNGATYNIYTGQTNAAYFGLPTIIISGFIGRLGGSWPYRYGPDVVTQGADNVSLVRGNHSIKFGGEFLRNTALSDEAAGTKGEVTFGGLQDFFSGNAIDARRLYGDLARHFSNWEYALYIQDDWRVKPRLTLNLGLRYQFSTVMTDANDLMGNFDPNVGMEQLGKQISSLYNPDYANFAPRLGFAWDIRGNGKTVLRGGAGIYYEPLSYDVFNAGGAALRTMPTGANLYANGVQVASPGNIVAGEVVSDTGTSPGQFGFNWINNGPNTPLFTGTPSCGDGTPVLSLTTTVTPTPCTIMGVNRNLYSPYVVTWTVDLQRAITNSLSLEVGYVANRGFGLLGLTDINEPPLGAGWTAAAQATCIASAADSTPYDKCSPDPVAEQAARPLAGKFPYLSYIPFYSNSNLSRYESLQTTLTQRLSHGLSFTAGYTYSHGLDDSSDNQQILHIPISGNQAELYASSDFDIRHRFTLSTTYNIPGMKGRWQMLEGWSLNSIVTLQSGMPWGVGDSSHDFSGTGELFDGSGPGSPLGELWNLYGNPADFNLVHGDTANNGGSGGVPFSGSDPTGKIMAACVAADNSHFSGTQLKLAMASLANAGCYAAGSSVLVPPPYGSIGNAGRNIFRDSGFGDWDLSVNKAWKFSERLSAQFRVDFFNILNHPNFANPWGGSGGGARSNDPSLSAYGCGCSTPDVGAADPVLGTGGARDIQLGLKLIF